MLGFVYDCNEQSYNLNVVIKSSSVKEKDELLGRLFLEYFFWNNFRTAIVLICPCIEAISSEEVDLMTNLRKIKLLQLSKSSSKIFHSSRRNKVERISFFSRDNGWVALLSRLYSRKRSCIRASLTRRNSFWVLYLVIKL